MPCGCGGKTLGPPIFPLSNPEALSAMSRTISASTRMRGPRASKMLSGSRSRRLGVMFEDWRYVADVTISRCIAFILHFCRGSSVASQSSNSGFVGRWPITPKSSTV
jgi:hypothetical protein